MLPRSLRIPNSRTKTLWMAALLSVAARYCQGFRSSSLSSSSSSGLELRSHRLLIHGCRMTPASLPSQMPVVDRSDGFRLAPQGNQQRGNRCVTSLSLSQNNNNNNNLITSPKSQTVKKVQALLSKRKQRLRYGQTIVEGPRMVFDLLDNPRTAHLVQQVLVSARDYELRDDYRSRLFGGEDDGADGGPPRDLLVQLVHPEIFPDCTDTVSPQGIVAIVDIPVPSDLFSDGASRHESDPVATAAGTAPMYLVLDGVSDPGNLGTLLRTSLAVGVAGVVLLPDCCDVWNPKAVRSAMGASFQIPILEFKSWEEALSDLRGSGGVRGVYAATMIEGDGSDHDDIDDAGAPRASIPYFDVDWTDGPSALVIGSEGNGLSPVVRDDLVARTKGSIRATHIPMGAGIESLNAAVCGSVILFEYGRQCQRPS